MLRPADEHVAAAHVLDVSTAAKVTDVSTVATLGNAARESSGMFYLSLLS